MAVAIIETFKQESMYGLSQQDYEAIDVTAAILVSQNN